MRRTKTKRSTTSKPKLGLQAALLALPDGVLDHQLDVARGRDLRRREELRATDSPYLAKLREQYAMMGMEIDLLERKRIRPPRGKGRPPSADWRSIQLLAMCIAICTHTKSSASDVADLIGEQLGAEAGRAARDNLPALRRALAQWPHTKPTRTKGATGGKWPELARLVNVVLGYNVTAAALKRQAIAWRWDDSIQRISGNRSV